MRMLRAVGLSLLALAAACGDEHSENAPIVRPVLSTIVQPRSQAVQSYAGSIEPQVSASLAFRLLGRVVSRNVDIGDSVKKGVAIASLDAATLQLQVQAARADVSSAQAQFANAAASEERQRSLLESKNTPQSVYDAAMQARQTAQAGVEQAQAALAKAQEQLGYAQLFSDFDGIVTAVGAEVGQIVAAGQSIVTVARSDMRDAVVDMPEQDAVLLKTGEVFQVDLQSAAGIEARAQVREIAPQADAATRTRRVKLGLVNPPPAFRIGSTVTVTRDVAVTPRIVLPQSALLSDGGMTQVWTVDPAAATVSLRQVKVATAAPGFIVVASGLEPGTHVVTAGVHSLTQGQKVRVDTTEPSP